MADSTMRYGYLAQFATPAACMAAAEKVRDAGYRRWDVYTPFPIHGMDDAMGLRNSRVGWFTFIGGVTGYTLGMLMTWYMNAYDYGIVVGGKPLWAPTFVFPVCYECTILLGAFGSLLGMLFLNRLPRLYHPLFNSERFRAATHDGYFVVIEATDSKFNEAETRRLLEQAGSTHIEEVRD